MRTLALILFLFGGKVSAQLLQGPSALEVPANSYVNITNSTTNVFYLTSMAQSFTNYVPSSGTSELWVVRSAFSNLIFSASFTNVRCITYYFPSPVYVGRNDGYRWKNGTTNLMKILYGVGIR